MPSFTPGVLGDISNLSAVERRRKWARDKYASMSPEEKKRLLQKNREYRQLKKDGTSTNLAASTTVIGKQGHQVMLTPQRQPFADLTAQGFNEVDVDRAGDCVLPTSCITQLKQGGSLVVAHQSAITGTPLTPANVLTKDCTDDYSWLRRNDAYERTTRYGEVEDNDYQNGDTSQEIVQPPSMSGANVELMEGEAIVHDVDDDDDDDEGYLMRGRDIEFESYQMATMSVDASTVADDKIYRNLPAPLVLKRAADCKYCNAKRFQYESPAWCCRKGKIVIANTAVPDELHRLFTSQSDVDARYFREHIRYFNSHFSFTSLGVTLDQRYCNGSSGVYTFRAQGQVYHHIDQLQPGDHGPRHLQLYFYDTDSNLAHRVQRSPDLDVNLIRNILHILQNNPYVHTFRTMGSVQNLDEYRISLNTNIILDQRVYNAPTASQVAAIWVEGNDPQNRFDRSLVVYGREERPRYIKAYHGCYDALSYPLFFPTAEVGWNRFLPYKGDPLNEHPFADAIEQPDSDDEEGNGSGSYVSAREYYRFKLQMRVGIFNVVLYGGRLF